MVNSNISQDDSLPKKICDSCSSKLDTFYQFWNETANAEKQLLQWLNQTTLGPIPKAGQTETKHKMDSAEVKEEAVDVGDGGFDDMKMSSDAQTYVLQQQQLPYSTPSKVRPAEENNETEEIPPKRPRRASAIKALEHMGSEEEDDPDYDGDNYTKAESDDSEKDEEDDEDETYREGPSTSMDDQPGTSGMTKGSTETPKMEKGNVKIKPNKKSNKSTRRPKKNETIVLTPELQESSEVKKMQNNKDICSGGLKKIILSKYAPPKKKRYRKDDPKKIPCKICNRRFTFNYLLKIHFHKDAELNEFSCSICGKIYTKDEEFKEHLDNAHAQDVSRLECSNCGKQYTYEGDLNRHIKTKHEGFIYKCDVCEKAFNNEQTLKEHVMVKHDDTYVKPKYPCTFCDKLFSCKKTLMLHIKNIHYGMRHFYVCDMCGKSLATPNSFRNHLRTHTNDKPFPCDICGKRFGRNHHLQDHLVTHTKEKPHICSKCGKAFTQRAPLLRHMKCVHETARPYQCLICSKSFATKSLVHTHAKLHNVIN